MNARKLQFSGILFDGKSARKHTVEIVLTPREIIIKQQGLSPFHWSYSNLRWAASVNSPFHLEHGDLDSPFQETLVVDDPVFYESVSSIAPSNLSNNGNQTEFNWKFYVAGILILIFSAYILIKTVPTYLADRMVEKIPVELEVILGQSMLNMLPLLQEPDKKILMVLQDTVDLLEQSVEGYQPYNMKVYILPGKTVNALALPGGSIVVFEGLLHKAESAEEIAGVLAHEIQHILLRHSTRGILRNVAQSMLLSLFIGDVNAVMEGVTNLAGELETLGFSREMETEADKKGMELILNANINPYGMVRIFEKILQDEVKSLPGNKSTKNEMELLSYLSTHPSSRSRLKMLEKQIEGHENRTWEPLFPELDWNEIKPEN